MSFVKSDTDFMTLMLCYANISEERHGSISVGVLKFKVLYTRERRKLSLALHAPQLSQTKVTHMLIGA